MRIRKCIQSGAVLPEHELVRFAIAPDGLIVPDVRARAPGRGLWLHADAQTLEEAMKKRSFARAAKRAVQVPEDLPGQTRAALVQAAQNVLGLARRAGELVCGFDPVRGFLRTTRPACLIEATDGSLDGRTKLVALARAKWGEVTIVDTLDKAQLGAPLGRAESVHLVLCEGALAGQFRFHADRLAAMRLLFHR